MKPLLRLASKDYPAIARNLTGHVRRRIGQACGGGGKFMRRIAFYPVACLMMLFMLVAYCLDLFAHKIDPEDHDRLSNWFLDT